MLVELTEEVRATLKTALHYLAGDDGDTDEIEDAHRAIDTPAPIGVALDVLDGAMRAPVFAHLEGYQKFEGGIVMLAQVQGRRVVKPEKQSSLPDALIALSREVEGE